MILDPTLGHHASRIPSEHRLVAAIISRAVLDLFAKVQLTSKEDEGDVIKRDALLFLTATGGAWAQRRRELCETVDLCPDTVRRRVVEMLEGKDVTLIDDRHAFSDVERARFLWQDEARREAAAHEARLAHAETVRLRRAHEAAMQAERDVHDATHARLAELHDVLGNGPVTRVVATLINGPLTIRQIGFALDGNLESAPIRRRLQQAQERGFVLKDGAEWRLLDLKEHVAA